MVLEILKNLNIKELNTMQIETLDAAKNNQDIILHSPTGSGKTLAFLMRALQCINPKQKGIQILIIVPTRELAVQIEQVLKKATTNYKINSCYGGHSTKTERFNFKEMPSILVGTPGRLCHHLDSKHITTENIKLLVLDEFDKILEFGFQEELGYIMNQLNSKKQLILTSATTLETFPDFIQPNNPVTLNYFKTKEDFEALSLKLINSKQTEKLDTLIQLISQMDFGATIIFCNHREAVERLSEGLSEFGFIHEIFHGGMEQPERERALIKFKNGSCHILIATDLASRGIDIPEISHIIHYQLPLTEDAFIHRNGRTARMKATGTSYILHAHDEKLPKFIPNNISEIILESKRKKCPEPAWETLYINLGKKDKINKVDIVGLLLQKGGLKKEELGLIDVLDFCAYVAVKREKTISVLKLTANQKLKNKSFKISLAK